MSFPPPKKFTVPAIIVVGLAVASVAVVATARARVARIGQTIRFDDSSFTVQAAKRTAPMPGASDTSPPDTVDYVITLTADNQAKRVPFRFHGWSLVLFDPRAPSRVYRVKPDQRPPGPGAEKHVDPLVLKAGESATQDYTFSVPADLIAPRLKFMPGGRIGETLDKLLGEYTEIQLP